jgi:predicted secreted protein
VLPTKLHSPHAKAPGNKFTLLTSGTAASDTYINLVILNVGVLNINTNATGITSKRAVGSWHNQKSHSLCSLCTIL